MWWTKDGHKFFDIPSIERRSMFPLRLGGLCDCLDQQNVVEVTLGQFPGPGLKKLASSTFCLLLLEASHHKKKCNYPETTKL